MKKQAVKMQVIFEKVKDDLLKGKYGESGSRFLSVREFADEYGVSYVTAQKTVLKLRDEGYVLLVGKKSYITNGKIKEEAPLSKVLQKSKLNNDYIGLHVNKVNNVFFASVTEKIQHFLKEKGYELIIMSSAGNFEDEKKIISSFVNELGVKGIISFPGHNKGTMELYSNCIVPAVLVGTEDMNNSISSVSVDNDKGARMAAKHLLECGYDDFCYVGTSKLTNEKDKRYKGFSEEIKKEGKYTKLYRIDSDYPKEIRGELKQFIMNSKKPLGIFCYHDSIAAEVYSICRKYKKNIPDEVGIVGFDDLPIASMLSPKLTTVAYRYDIMAEAAVSTLLEMVSGLCEEIKCDRIHPALTVRGSTKMEK